MDNLIARVDAEALALLRVLFGGRGLALLTILVGIWLLAFTVKKAARLRTGVLSQHALTNPIINGLASSAAIAIVVRFLFAAAPLLVTTVIVVAGSAMVFGLGLRARAWLAGLSQVLSSRLRVGDRLTFDVASGVIERIGLFRLTLRAEAGELVHVPIAALDGRAFNVSSPERAFPVAVLFHLEDTPSPALLDTARVAARLCPYRAVGSDATITVDANDPKRLHVRFRAWSETAARRADAYLRARVS